MRNTKSKVEYFEELRTVINAIEDAEQKADLNAFIDAQLAILAKRKESAAVRAAKKREESDALTDTIYDVLTEEFATVDEIVAAVADPEVTRNKVIARLSKLIKAGKVIKDNVVLDDNKKCVGYALVNDEAEEA